MDGENSVVVGGENSVGVSGENSVGVGGENSVVVDGENSVGVTLCYVIGSNYKNDTGVKRTDEVSIE